MSCRLDLSKVSDLPDRAWRRISEGADICREDARSTFGSWQRKSMRSDQLVASRLRIAADMRALTASPVRTALPAAHFDRNESYAYFGDRTLL